MNYSRILKIVIFMLIILLLSIQFLGFRNSSYFITSNPLGIFSNNFSKSFSHTTSSVSVSVPEHSVNPEGVSIITRWILTLWSFVTSDGRSVFESKQRTDTLLLVRKLVIFSVRAVNQRLAGTACSPWWVNPLSVTEFEEKVAGEGGTEYKLTFKIQPGMIPFESVVRRRLEKANITHPYPTEDLFLIDARRLEPSNCPKMTLRPELAKICLCPEEKRVADMITGEVRMEWAQTDHELLSWPPDVSMSVPDYIKFGSMDLYLKNPNPNKTDFCGPEVKMILFISSAPGHFRQRLNIRKTFGNFTFLEDNGVRLVFLFGTVKDTELQALIDEEFLQNNDIVQADFVDSYHNLSLSHLSMYNWVLTHCKTQGSHPPPWIFKADDDFFLNVPLARRIAETNPQAEFIGTLFCGTTAIRNISYMKKYYVPRYMYAPDYYAGYVSGVAYLVRTDVLQPILKASLTTPLIHMDDAYVMGLLTRDVGIRPQGSPLITYLKAKSACGVQNMMSSYVKHNLTLEVMWAQFQEPNLCSFDERKLMVKPLSERDYQFCLYNPK